MTVEDILAEIWQDCLERTYGKPKITKNPKGTETDRLWKFPFGTDIESIDITLHFYNHNKPKDKKKSKILIQGSIQSILCDYVFNELPKIYKLVCSMKAATLTVTPLPPLRQRAPASLVKRRSIRYIAFARGGALLTYP